MKDGQELTVHVWEPSANWARLVSEIGDEEDQGEPEFYRGVWVVGEHIDADTAETFYDVDSRALYVVMHSKDPADDTTPYLVQRDAWISMGHGAGPNEAMDAYLARAAQS